MDNIRVRFVNPPLADIRQLKVLIARRCVTFTGVVDSGSTAIIRRMVVRRHYRPLRVAGCPSPAVITLSTQLERAGQPSIGKPRAVHRPRRWTTLPHGSLLRLDAHPELTEPGNLRITMAGNSRPASSPLQYPVMRGGVALNRHFAGGPVPVDRELTIHNSRLNVCWFR